jgi:hypothetical protein
MGHQSCINRTLIPTLNASHSISNACIKSGKAKTGANHFFLSNEKKLILIPPPI